MLEQKNVTVKAGSSFQTICPFPVGYIYQSYNSTSPANIYGGSWTPIAGRFLYCNSGTGVGGSNSYNHTHTYGFGATDCWGTITAFQLYNNGSWTDWNNNSIGSVNMGFNASLQASMHSKSLGHYRTKAQTSNVWTDNMPAYQTCYAWRRTN